MDCVRRLKALGIPDMTILIVTAFIGEETLDRYVEISEKEAARNVAKMQSKPTA